MTLVPMGFAATCAFYLLVGAAVAAAVLLSRRAARGGELAFRASTAILFWPLYLPLLLAQGGRSAPHGGEEALPPRDPLREVIERVEGELARALDGLGGWAEGVLARESGRIEELKRTWRAQAERIRRIEAVLEDESRAAPAPPPPTLAGAAEAAGGASERLLRCEEARRQNLERLRELRRKTQEDLLGTLAWVRELVSMIHLARFTGAPASRAGELIGQIAASVEGLSAVTAWGDDPQEGAARSG